MGHRSGPERGLTARQRNGAPRTSGMRAALRAGRQKPIYITQDPDPDDSPDTPTRATPNNPNRQPESPTRRAHDTNPLGALHVLPQRLDRAHEVRRGAGSPPNFARIGPSELGSERNPVQPAPFDAAGPKFDVRGCRRQRFPSNSELREATSGQILGDPATRPSGLCFRPPLIDLQDEFLKGQCTRHARTPRPRPCNGPGRRRVRDRCTCRRARALCRPWPCGTRGAGARCG